MSVPMFTFMGLGPLSAAIAGSLLKVISLPALFGGAVLTLSAIALGYMTSPARRGTTGGGSQLRIPDKVRRYFGSAGICCCSER